jgi:hypothetical protein
MQSWEEQTWRRKRRDDSDVEGVLVDLSVSLSVFSPILPMFSVCVRLLCFFLRLRPSLSTSFSSSILPCSADLFAENGAKTERQSLLALAFDDLKKP